MIGKAVDIVTFLMANGSDKDWELKEYKEKRSLNANKYFHVLCDMMRQVTKESMAKRKNYLITKYGQIMYLPDGEPMIYKTNAPPEFVEEQEEPHMKLVKTSEENGKPVYYYRMYRGSRTYNTKEMSQLIEGAILEAMSEGIPEQQLLTPTERAKLIAMWGDAIEKQKNQGD